MNVQLFRCVIGAEGDVEREIHTFATRAEMEAFGQGVYIGANLYGAGGCAAIYEDEVDVLEREGEITKDQAAQARKLFAIKQWNPPSISFPDVTEANEDIKEIAKQCQSGVMSGIPIDGIEVDVTMTPVEGTPGVWHGEILAVDADVVTVKFDFRGMDDERRKSR